MNENEENWAVGIGDDYLELQMIHCLNIVVNENIILQFQSSFMNNKDRQNEIDRLHARYT